MESYSLVKSSILSRIFFGLFASLVMASIGVYAGQYVPRTLLMILVIAELVMIGVAMFIQRRRAIGMPFVLTFAFISGLTLYPTIALYVSTLGAAIVIKALLVSAVAFLVAAVVASRTSFDFSFLGGFLLIGLFAVVIMGIVSIFISFSTMASLVYSLIGIGVFVGYVLYDVNRIAHQGITEQMTAWVVLSLYLDFINLFLFVLRLFGVLQDSRR